MGSSAVQSGLSLATSLVQGIQANKLKKKADAAMPDQTDPTQLSFLADLNQKRKAIDTGADFQQATQEADANQATANDAIVGASGGNTNSLMQALLQSQNAAGTQKNRAIADGQQQQMQYNSAYGNMLNKIAARKLELQMQQSQQARGEWATMKQKANQNFMAGIGGLLGGKKPGAPATAGAPVAEAPAAAPEASAPAGGAASAISGASDTSGELSTLLGGI